MIDKKFLDAVELYAKCVPPGEIDQFRADDIYHDLLMTAQQIVRHHAELNTLEVITNLVKIVYLSAVSFQRLHND